MGDTFKYIWISCKKSVPNIFKQFISKFKDGFLLWVRHCFGKFSLQCKGIVTVHMSWKFNRNIEQGIQNLTSQNPLPISSTAAFGICKNTCNRNITSILIQIVHIYIVIKYYKSNLTHLKQDWEMYYRVQCTVCAHSNLQTFIEWTMWLWRVDQSESWRAQYVIARPSNQIHNSMSHDYISDQSESWSAGHDHRTVQSHWLECVTVCTKLEFSWGWTMNHHRGSGIS